MSANNWRVCPKCIAERAAEKVVAEQVAAKAYGKVSADEYLKLLEAAEDQGAVLEETLREDYEIYTSESGRFVVSYGCSCSHCGFEHSFSHTENALAEPPKKAKSRT